MKGEHIIGLMLVLLLIATSCRKKAAEEKIDPTSPLALGMFLANYDGDTIRTDTLKLGLKSGRRQSTFYLHVNGDGKSKIVMVQVVNGQGSLTVGGRSESTFSIGNGTHLVQWTPSTLGTTLLKFQLRDEQYIREAQVQVNAFDNLPPQATLKVEKLAQISPLEYLIDASHSYDDDTKFGGGIISYEYNIDGKTFSTDRPSINWIFETVGNHKIQVNVSDADGATSTYATIVQIL